MGGRYDVAAAVRQAGASWSAGGAVQRSRTKDSTRRSYPACMTPQKPADVRVTWRPGTARRASGPQIPDLLVFAELPRACRVVLRMPETVGTRH